MLFRSRVLFWFSFGTQKRTYPAAMLFTKGMKLNPCDHAPRGKLFVTFPRRSVQTPVRSRLPRRSLQSGRTGRPVRRPHRQTPRPAQSRLRQHPVHRPRHPAHAVRGMEIYQAGKEEPLQYNKEDLLNPWFIVEPLSLIHILIVPAHNIPAFKPSKAFAGRMKSDK